MCIRDRFIREIGGYQNVPGISSTQVAFNEDLTLTVKNFSVFAEYIHSNGADAIQNYVSGGPSSSQDLFSSGVNYKCGPVSAHIDFSEDWEHNPGGHQWLFNPGITFQLTKNVTLYTEYVKWILTNSENVHTTYDNGFELILVWKL